jgi:uncharacterized protein (TIGR02996 family)
MADPPPPEEVQIEFLRALAETVASYGGTLIPVLRGSMLMRHWFGAQARPAADIDLECFVPSGDAPRPRVVERYSEQGYGPDRAYESRLALGRAACRDAVESTIYSPFRQHQDPSGIEFAEGTSLASTIMTNLGFPPAPRVDSLWSYGTPGERYFLNWKWWGRKGREGRLQIDVAESLTYGIDDIDTRPETWMTHDERVFDFVGYTPEMLLAAKLSWLLRSFRAPKGNSAAWTGQAKDLFDAHLLITGQSLRAIEFQKSLTAIGIEDDLEWQYVDVLLSAGRRKPGDHEFPNWKEFQNEHSHRLACGPGEMLAEIAAQLPALLGDFHRPRDERFLAAIAADPVDEFAYKLYADELEERGDAAAPFLRLFSQAYFHKNELSSEQRAETNRELQASLAETSKPWLLRLFGTSARYREMTGRIAAGKLA